MFSFLLVLLLDWLMLDCCGIDDDDALLLLLVVLDISECMHSVGSPSSMYIAESLFGSFALLDVELYEESLFSLVLLFSLLSMFES